MMPALTHPPVRQSVRPAVSTRVRADRPSIDRPAGPNGRPASRIVEVAAFAPAALPNAGVNVALIARVREEIRRGEYDTERRFNIAVSRMIESVRAGRA